MLLRSVQVRLYQRIPARQNDIGLAAGERFHRIAQTVAQVEIVATGCARGETYLRTRSGTRVIFAPSAFKRSSIRS